MKRLAVVASAAFVSASAANADGISDRMYSATLAVKATAMIASEFERCGVDTSRMPNTMIDWAANSCHASEAEISQLRSVYDHELANLVKKLKSESPRCRWSPEQTESELQSSLSSIEGFAKSPCRQ